MKKQDFEIESRKPVMELLIGIAIGMGLMAICVLGIIGVLYVVSHGLIN